MSSPSHSSSTLRNRTHAFCRALVSPPEPSALLTSHFRLFSPSHPRITEHGPAWARTRLPFLGHDFSGHEECVQYFTLLNEVLEMKLPEDAFPEAKEFIVDAEAGMVSVVGKGTFVSKKTGKSWDEEFIYRFSEFDEEGRIGWWEIWADPLSAWVAVGGEKEG